MGELAETILETMRRHMKLSIGVVAVERPGQGMSWRIDATDPAGHRFIVEDEDYYEAAVHLAELVGFDLRDG